MIFPRFDRADADNQILRRVCRAVPLLLRKLSWQHFRCRSCRSRPVLCPKSLQMVLRAARNADDKIKPGEGLDIVAKSGSGVGIERRQLELRGIVKNRDAFPGCSRNKTREDSCARVAVNIRNQKYIARSQLILQAQALTKDQAVCLGHKIL